MKTTLILIALALLVGLLFTIGWRSDVPVAASAPNTARGPSFEVLVEKPLSARPLFGILPAQLEKKLAGHGDLKFDNASPGAKIVTVEHDRLELRADGWEFLIETDGEGTVAPGTHLVFSLELADKQRTLRCRPADPPDGYFRTAVRAGSGEIDGVFRVELATCVNVETRKTIEWPPAPLTVLGSFEGLLQGAN